MKYIIDVHQGIGDIIHILPLLEIIRINDVSAKVFIIVAYEGQVDLLHQYKEIVVVTTIRKIVKCRFAIPHADYGLITSCIYNKKKSALFLMLLGSKKIIFPNENYVHRVEQNISIAMQLGYTTTKVSAHPRLYRINNFNGNSKVKIAIAMGGYGKKGKDYKRWPYKNWISFINQIDEKIEIMLIAGVKEKKEFENYEKELNRKCTNLMGILSLKESIEEISKCCILIGNDTGMVHIAGALGIKTIVLYGPTDPQIIGVHSPNTIYITSSRDCSPCYKLNKKIQCKKPSCMNNISVEEVMYNLNQFIEERKKGETKKNQTNT